jgi:hypothetical protein
LSTHSKWAEAAPLGMVPTPVAWDRGSWRATGAVARLMSVVFGAFPDGANLRIDRTLKDSPLTAALHPRLITRAQHGAVIDHWTRGTFGKALDDSLDADRAESVRHAEAALVLQAEVVDPRDLGYLRDFAQILARAQSAEVVATLDVYAVKWATPDAVQEAATHPGFRVRDHLSTTAANDPQYAPGLRLHSRGAIKLGRPELEVRHIRPDARALRGAAMIVEGALKLLADGLEPTDGGNYVLPGFTEHFSVVTSPDDSQGAQHFMNRSAEIRDCTLTSKVGPDASALLAEAEGRVRA